MVDSLKQDTEIAQAYYQYEEGLRRENAFVEAWTVFVAMLAGSLLDYWVYPDKVFQFFLIRLSVAILMLPILCLLKFTKLKTTLLEVIIVMSPVVGISIMIALTNGSDSIYYAGINLVLVGVGVFLRWRLVKSVLLCIGFVIIYLLACANANTEFFTETLYVNTFFIVVTSFLICVGGNFYYESMFREFGLRFQLKRNQKELAEKNKQLEELDQIKSQFFANISHELRTPLTLIIGPLTRLIRRDDMQSDPELSKTLQSMESNSLRLLQLINDLLELVRVESGAIQNDLQEIKVGDFVKGIVSSCHGLGDEKQLSLSSHIDLKQETFWLDSQHLEKILLNLIFNGIKFTPYGGKIDVSVSQSDKQLVFVVKDNGVGMSQENADKSFEMFWQQDNTSRRKYQGVGIGLALVKNLIDTMDGEISVQSEEEVGTEITFKIPLYSEKPERTIEDREKNVEQSKEDEHGSDDISVESINNRAKYYFPKQLHASPKQSFTELVNLDKPKILIADDEPEMLDYISNAIEKKYQVVRAVDGPQVESMAKQVLPSLIILDMMMPEKNGIEVAQSLSDDFLTQSIPILMLTARADEETKLDALRAGVNDFLTKPFSHTELEVRLENLLKNSELQVELSKKNTKLKDTLQKLKESEVELVRQEKFASIGRLSAGLVHEINNPLNYVKASIYHMKSFSDQIGEDREEFDDTMTDLEEGVLRVINIITDLKTLTQSNATDRKAISVPNIIDRCIKLSDKITDNIEIEVDVYEGLNLLANENQLTQILINLFNNACDAMTEKGNYAKLKIRGIPSFNSTIIEVSDNGSGIPKEIVDKIFDPFFTTKAVGSGMGLGLAISYQWIKQNKGEIRVDTEIGVGTTFIMEFEKVESTIRNN